MRCTTCDYRLWNLRSRNCPECGTEFSPSDFEFIPNSVRFICPHCDQCYYGTSGEGHLVPPEFDCVSCGRHIHMDEMVLLPTAGIEEEQTAPASMPWLERSKRGFFRGWLPTVGLALVGPGRLIRAVPPNSSMISACWFAVFTNLPVALLNVAPFLAFMYAMGPGVSSGAAFLAAVMVAIPLLLTIWLAIWGGVAHGLLCLLASPIAGPRRTYQALCYSAGANAPSAAPCIGMYFGWIWWLVSAVVMIKEGQRVSGWRASVAVLVLPMLAIGSIIGFYAYLFLSVLPAMSATTWVGPTDPKDQTQQILDTVLTHAWMHQGRGPDHALQLVTLHDFPVEALLSLDVGTGGVAAPTGNAVLDQFVDLTPDQRVAQVTSLIASMPQDIAAHRVGDLVYVYHGVDLGNCDPGLWVVIRSPLRDPNELPAPDETIFVGLANHDVIEFPIAELPAKLEEQNALRQGFELPPVPDPAQVRPDDWAGG